MYVSVVSSCTENMTGRLSCQLRIVGRVMPFMVFHKHCIITPPELDVTLAGITPAGRSLKKALQKRSGPISPIGMDCEHR